MRFAKRGSGEYVKTTVSISINTVRELESFSKEKGWTKRAVLEEAIRFTLRNKKKFREFVKNQKLDSVTAIRTYTISSVLYSEAEELRTSEGLTRSAFIELALLFYMKNAG